MSTVRDQIRKRSIYWADPGEWKPTASDLVYFFEQAKTEAKPTLGQAEHALANRDTGVTVGGQVKHWCGIFACAVLREIGVDVRWTLYGGKMVDDKDQPGASGVKLVMMNWSPSGLRRGDIGIISAGQHHFIIIDVDYSGNTMETVEGNTSGQLIRRRERKIKGGGSQSPYAYYRLQD